MIFKSLYISPTFLLFKVVLFLNNFLVVNMHTKSRYGYQIVKFGGSLINCGVEHQYWVFDEKKGADSAISLSSGLGFAGHLLFSPDNNWLIADSYPYKNNQFLNITRIEDKKVHQIGSFYHDPAQKGDWRCDLHLRWNKTGSFITVDSIHYGERKILLLNFEEMKKQLV